MNAVASLPPRDRAPPSKSSTDHASAAAVAKALTRVRETLRKPFDVAAALERDHPEWARGLFDDRRYATPKSQAGVAYRKREIAARLQELAPKDRLVAVRGAMETVVATPFNPETTRVLLGLMIDSFPNGRQHVQPAYLETMASELEVSGYPPQVVAVACAEIVRSAKFLPTTAEVLGHCAEFKRRAATKVTVTAKGIAAIEDLRRETEELDGLQGLPEQDPPPPGRIPYAWRAECPEWRDGDPIPF